MTVPLKEPIFSLKVYLEFRNITHNTICNISNMVTNTQKIPFFTTKIPDKQGTGPDKCYIYL